MDAYINTTKSTGKILDLFEAKAQNQEGAIASFFIRNENRDFTPSEVWARLYDGSVPLTSVRRAITRLTDAGVLSKTEQQRKGPYGRPEFCWTSNVPRTAA